MYEMQIRVGYSHVNWDRVADITQIANYFQDCTLFHSEDVNMGFEILESNKRAWFLSGWQIEVNRYPRFGESLLIRTWPYHFKGIYGYRIFDILDGKGKKVAMANSIWTFMDLEKGRPTKPQTEDVKPYIGGQELPMEYQKFLSEEMKRKIDLPKAGSDFKIDKAEKINIGKKHIDSNMHVNNAKYIELASAYLPEGFCTKQLQVDYRKAACEGDIMAPMIYRNPKEEIVVFLDEFEKPYVIAAFRS